MKKATTVALLLTLTASMFGQGIEHRASEIQHSENRSIKSVSFDGRHAVSQDIFFTRFKQSFGLTSRDRLEKTSSVNDNFGTHSRYKQLYNGLEVIGAEYILHEANGVVRHANGNVVPRMTIETTPLLHKDHALTVALKAINARSYKWETEKQSFASPEGTLAIASKNYQMTTESMRLVYAFDIYAESPLGRYTVHIDARTGAVVNKFNRIHTADINATGTSKYNGNVSFTAENTGSSHRLRQSTLGNGIQTYSMNNGTNYANAQDVTSSSSNFTSDPTAVQAHWGAEQTYKYFNSKHARNSYDNAGAIIKSYVHYSSGYVNAYWDGSRMTYGDGDGTQYGPLVSLDIVGHEISHAVTEKTANLVYQNESGALNESFSDIFGEAIENFSTNSNDWLMGKDIGINRDGSIRSMINPKRFNNPDCYGGTNWYTGSGDNGGVHINSGVQNHWFYILSVGKSATNDKNNAYNVTGIGIEKAAKIAYRNLSTYLTTSSNYADARTGAIRAASDLYGATSAEVIATTNAWYAVGVGAAYSGGGSDTTAPVISAIASSNVTQNSAVITWETNEAATSQVEYGTSTAYGSTTSETTAKITSHSVSLSGLTASTTYNYRVKSKDAAGNMATSANNTFTTSASGGGGNGDIEPNNSFAQASALTLGTKIDGHISASGDNDYFKFSIPKAGAVKITLASLPGDYDVYLYNSSQTELGKGYTTNDPEIVNYNASGAATFYVKVNGYNGANSSTDSYELTVTFTESASAQWYYLNQVMESAHPYANYTNTTKSYSKPGAQKVAVHFSRFETETNYDFVKIKDKNGAEKASHHGTKSAFWAIVDGDKIDVNFVSDYSITKWGYKIDQVGYYATSALTNGLTNELSVAHINNEKGNPVNSFASKDFATDGLPTEFKVDGAYPNPFNPVTNIKFYLAEQSHVKVEILNILGQVVKTLHQGHLDGGTYHVIPWNAELNQGVKAASGVYFYRVQAGNKIETNKLVLLK